MMFFKAQTIVYSVSPGADRLSEELLENENDRQIGNVANKVSTLKHVR